MSTDEAQPKRAATRSNDDRIRRANLADVASGFDAFVPLDWIRSTGASVSGTLIAWNRGELAEVPVGRAWDVVRMPRSLGWRTVTALRTAGAEVGPVLHTDTHVEVFVPVGSLDDWDQDDATVLGKDDGVTLSVPHPSVIAPHTSHARSWIVAPYGPQLTDGAAVYEAYAAARVTARMGVAR